MPENDNVSNPDPIRLVYAAAIGETRNFWDDIRALGVLTQMVGRCCADESPSRTAGRDEAMDETAVALGYLSDRMLDIAREGHRAMNRCDRDYRRLA